MSQARIWQVAVWGAAALYAVLISVESLYNHSTYRTGFDSAIYDQRLWLLSQLEEPFSTVVSRPFLADHFEPGLVLLTPMYWLGPDVRLLYVVQAIAVACVAPALWKLARAAGASPGLAAIPAMLWLVSPAVAAANLFEFRPAAFAPVFVVLSVYFALERKYVLTGVTTVLALSVKEDVALMYMMIGLVLVYLGRRRLGALIVAGSLATFVLGVVLIRSLGNQYEWQGRRFAGHRGDSFLDAAAWMLRHPLQTLGDSLRESGVDFVILVLSTGGLALLAPLWIVLAAPTALVNALSAYDPQHDLLNHYHLPVVTGLFVAAALGVGRLSASRRGARAIGLCLALAVPVIVVEGYRAHDLGGRLSSEERAEISHALSLVPDQAPVAAAPNVLPRLSHRAEVYSLPEPFIPLDWGSSLSRDEFAARAEQVEFAVFFGRTKPREFDGDMVSVWNMLRKQGFVPIVHGSHVQVLKRS